MKIIRNLSLLAVGLLLCACAQVATQPLPAPAQDSADTTFAVATLASIGSFEYEAAPAFTRNAALRHRSAALARAHKIDVDTLKQAIENCDRARAQLSAALKADREHNSVRAHQLLNDATAIINSAEVALNAGVK